jgi:quercetin dioxygenase-like cupin family protein
MDTKHALEVWAEAVEGLPGVTVRWLWSEKDGAPHFALRLFEVQPGSSTFDHTHPHEHEVYVLSGRALLRGKDQEKELGPDDTALVLGNEAHQFINMGQSVLRFLCAVPLEV